ncbi:hypothetical protein M430DRAFT_204697 [Amorphotheca resinae ATCC 22711]|jgi:hypothetical protein|uniref:Uncharacterized protein n=1 Tax=Amorphotheca resinae ATCC 22711 TaxID=857342 RepID=A0A2T3BBC7_AMORE|nr:hypothetical protein M430DRAFT_204697 [Amorphotheca resinae ATCC 22711]PSS25633.1 hypothetical protein M430DRAFT_204697 [Amorphotheca resinae ATCC 22711]
MQQNGECLLTYFLMHPLARCSFIGRGPIIQKLLMVVPTCTSPLSIGREVETVRLGGKVSEALRFFSYFPVSLSCQDGSTMSCRPMRLIETARLLRSDPGSRERRERKGLIVSIVHTHSWPSGSGQRQSGVFHHRISRDWGEGRGENYCVRTTLYTGEEVLYGVQKQNSTGRR